MLICLYGFIPGPIDNNRDGLLPPRSRPPKKKLPPLPSRPTSGINRKRISDRYSRGPAPRKKFAAVHKGRWDNVPDLIAAVRLMFCSLFRDSELRGCRENCFWAKLYTYICLLHVTMHCVATTVNMSIHISECNRK